MVMVHFNVPLAWSHCMARGCTNHICMWMRRESVRDRSQLFIFWWRFIHHRCGLCALRAGLAAGSGMDKQMPQAMHFTCTAWDKPSASVNIISAGDERLLPGKHLSAPDQKPQENDQTADWTTDELVQKFVVDLNRQVIQIVGYLWLQSGTVLWT